MEYQDSVAAYYTRGVVDTLVLYYERVLPPRVVCILSIATIYELVYYIIYI